MNSPQPNHPHPQRILVRGVNWLGDAVMTTPALQRLREHCPQTHITLLTPAKLADLWTDHPSLNNVLTFDAKDSPLKVGGKLREGKFDLGIALPNSARAALELWLAGIPQRVGYTGGGRALMLTHAITRRTEQSAMRKRTVAEIQRLIEREESVIPNSTGDGRARHSVRAGRRAEDCPPYHEHSENSPPSPSAHHVHHYLHLFATAFGCDSSPLAPFIAVSDAELKAMQGRLGMLEVDGAKVPLFGLNPGAEYGPAKRWPADRFVATAIELHRRTGCRWVIFGGKADTELAGGIAAQIQFAIRDHQKVHGEKTFSTVINLAGQTTLRELCAALKSCDAVLTNDTGPMHVAAAVGTPVVVPFGSTSPELTGPGLPGDTRHQLLKSNALCSPCFLRECPIDFRCMNGITVERVVAAMLQATGQS